MGLGLGLGYGAAWGSKYIVVDPEFDSLDKKDSRPVWLRQLQVRGGWRACAQGLWGGRPVWLRQLQARGGRCARVPPLLGGGGGAACLHRCTLMLKGPALVCCWPQDQVAVLKFNKERSSK